MIWAALWSHVENIIYPHQMHMWSLSEETDVISLELDHVPCGHLKLKSTGSSQGKKEKNPLHDPQRGKSYLDF